MASGLIPAHAGKTSMWTGQPSTRRAHPRSRGENDPGSTQPERLMGSSPLTRGKRSADDRHDLAGGLIPAHAGKTPGDPRAGDACRAHPRSRGENRLARRREGGEAGSSPLTRGKPQMLRARAITEGLIPAHAGKTACVTDVTCARWAHPRSRGENRPSLDARTW